MPNVDFSAFCKNRLCAHFYIFEYEEPRMGGVLMYSCELVGPSFTVAEYPETCPYLEEIRAFEKNFKNF